MQKLPGSKCALVSCAGLIAICIVTMSYLESWSRKTDHTDWPVDLLPAERDRRLIMQEQPKVIFDQNLTVICMIFTTPENWYSRGVAVQNTWSRRCPRSVFFYSKSSAQCPKHAICNVSNAVGLDVPEGRDHLTGKTMEALKYCYKTFGRSVDWYLKADDDVYIFFENFLEVLSWYNSSSPIYIGQTIHSIIPKGYQSGGAGYVLSKAAVAKMFENSTLFKMYCKGDGALEDVDIGSCLAGFGVYPEETRDAEGRLRFHSQNPLRVLNGESLSDHRFINFRGATFGNKKMKGKYEMLGRHTTSFHYVTPGEMYFIEFLAYDLKQQ